MKSRLGRLTLRPPDQRIWQATCLSDFARRHLVNHPLRLAGLGAAALLAAGTVTTAVVMQGADAATETLLSQGRPATSSSVETPSLGAALAFDGNTGTRWASAEGSDPQWVSVDLGATRSITHVNLNGEAAYGMADRIETSADATTWSTIYSTT